MNAPLARRGVYMVLACALALAVLFGFTFVSTAHATNCIPTAYTPAKIFSNGNWLGQAKGAVLGGSCSGSWSGKIFLKNGAGSTLQEATISGSGVLGGLETNWAVCNGAYVHTFMWINDGGVVKSDTSDPIYCG